MKHIFALVAVCVSVSCAGTRGHAEHAVTLPVEIVDTILSDTDAQDPYSRLTDTDYREVAERLGVEVPAIKAVVDIEAGTAHKGFWAPGKPIINFDLSMYRARTKKHGINLDRYRSSHPVIFAGPNARKYGSQQAGQQARLDAAMSIDSVSAIEGTFWGMFQIGGFNWKLCRTSSPQEFVKLMSRSERDQLNLFANMLEETGMVTYLRKKDWSGFARRYNGASYAKRGYHTKMAKAYSRYKGKG